MKVTKPISSMVLLLLFLRIIQTPAQLLLFYSYVNRHKIKFISSYLTCFTYWLSRSYSKPIRYESDATDLYFAKLRLSTKGNLWSCSTPTQVPETRYVGNPVNVSNCDTMHSKDKGQMIAFSNTFSPTYFEHFAIFEHVFHAICLECFQNLHA